MINIPTNAAAIMQSPELAMVNVQALMAGEMAARVGLASLETDRVRRQDQVPSTESGAGIGEVEDKMPRDAGNRPARRAKRAASAKEAGSPAGPEPLEGPHRIDLVA